MYRSIALAALLAASTAAQAGELGPYEAESIELGSIRGVTYFTEEQGGYRVVTTLAGDETALPVRFEATLADDQKLIFSVPGTFGEPGKVREISRAGNRLIISDPQSAAGKLPATGEIADFR